MQQSSKHLSFEDNIANNNVGREGLVTSNDLSKKNSGLDLIQSSASFCNQKQKTSLDFYVQRDGVIFAGTHLLLDLWDAKYLDDIDRMESALKECVKAANATLLHIHLHHFTPNGGISGVAVLAESHISVHTWPERSYAAFDVFMCGDAKPENTISVLKAAFEPANIEMSEHQRGIFPTDSLPSN